eukprot:CAMPEP_0117529130 /NCGR_PEP_ID=MMETSP0784-20121206/37675_1 /TAXON_ID=39447 /ORGANISM="" /LENGTH=44 /DNA_ID= /DNA_START= /DNA_END= /DNA_ORIENTATION=
MALTRVKAESMRAASEKMNGSFQNEPAARGKYGALVIGGREGAA